MLYVHTQTKKRSGSTTHRHQPADDWHQSHRQLQQMQHVSFSFNNDNNEKEKNNIYYICIYNHRTTKTNQKYPSVNL